MRTIAIIIFICFSIVIKAQEQPADTSINRVQIYEGFDLPSNYHFKYKQALRRVRRVYPLALHAAHIIDSLEQEVDETSRTRKQKRIARKTHRQLKDDFKFLLKELYVSEGIVLTKLIYRETGMTVKEIIAKYKGEAQASLYTGMAGLFEQDLDATYDPNGEDFVIECVVQDIKDGKVEFDSTFQTVDRQHYREDRKAYKKRVRKNKRKIRKLNREARRIKRKERREKRRNKKSED